MSGFHKQSVPKINLGHENCSGMIAQSPVMPESELYNNGAFVSFASFVGHKCLSITIFSLFLVMLIDRGLEWDFSSA